MACTLRQWACLCALSCVILFKALDAYAVWKPARQRLKFEKCHDSYTTLHSTRRPMPASIACKQMKPPLNEYSLLGKCDQTGNVSTRGYLVVASESKHNWSQTLQPWSNHIRPCTHAAVLDSQAQLTAAPDTHKQASGCRLVANHRFHHFFCRPLMP